MYLVARAFKFYNVYKRTPVSHIAIPQSREASRTRLRFYFHPAHGYLMYGISALVLASQGLHNLLYCGGVESGTLFRSTILQLISISSTKRYNRLPIISGGSALELRQCYDSH